LLNFVKQRPQRLINSVSENHRLTQLCLLLRLLNGHLIRADPSSTFERATCASKFFICCQVKQTIFVRELLASVDVSACDFKAGGAYYNVAIARVIYESRNIPAKHPPIV
jgi:hypothetical protein